MAAAAGQLQHRRAGRRNGRFRAAAAGAIIGTPSSEPVSIQIRTTLPTPSWLVTLICPPSTSTSRLLMASPKPVPPKRRAVEASACVNGSKTFAHCSSVMPMPESLTSNSSCGRGGPLAHANVHPHVPALGELDRVGHQVDEDLPQPRRVRLDVLGDPRRDTRLGNRAACRRPALHQVEHVVDHVRGRADDAFRLQLAGFDLGDIQDVVDQRQQVGAVALDGLHGVQLVGIDEVGQQQLGEAQDGGHGRANLVAHVGQEVGLGAAGGLGGQLGPPQLLLHLAALRDIEHGPDHPRGVAQRVPIDISAIVNEGVRAVGPAEAVLARPLLRAAVDRLQELPHHVQAVLGVHVVVPPGGAIPDVGRRMPESLFDPLAPPHLVVQQVPVPQHVVGGAGNELKPLLAELQLHGRAPAFDGVPQHAPQQAQIEVLLAEEVVCALANGLDRQPFIRRP